MTANLSLKMHSDQSTLSPTIFDAKAIRSDIRKKRNALSSEQQKQASLQLASGIIHDQLFQKANTIALYLSNDGEIDTTPTIKQAWKAKKGVALPVLHPFSKKHLLFLQYHQNSRLVANRFGIPEPESEVLNIVTLESLDIIYTPLVAFDKHGARIGMGGGFYDRTLAPLSAQNRRCRIIGLAHDCQQITTIDSQPWDMPMDEIFTPNQHIIITPRR
ncbi:MAG: 5-formyltetrahydrofolate cyclo-ligase [Aestuariibacter sp.]